MKALLKKIVVAVLTWEARLVLIKYKPKIIAITGNVGKTGTKDAIHTALASQLYIRKNKKTLNSETGVPLTILNQESAWRNPFKWFGVFANGLALVLFKTDYPKWLVLEVGTDEPGDIQAIAKWLKPDIVVITTLPSTPVHVANFDSPEEIVQEKLSLARALKPGGILILNGDDNKIREVVQEFAQHKVFYSGVKDGEIVYTNSVPIGMRYGLSIEGDEDEVVFLRGILGRQCGYFISAAFAVCEALNLNKHRAASALESYEAPPGRMRILEGITDSIIIDDSYNSSPLAMTVALDALSELKVKGKKIAVLGDMRELGKFSKKEHKIAGEYVAKIADVLITVGEESQVLADAAMGAGLSKDNIFRFGYYDSARAGEKVHEILQEGDVVLVKGSQNMIRTERVVKAIMKEPYRAAELIVRQEPEWLNKK